MMRFIIFILAIITFQISKAQDTNKSSTYNRATSIKKFNVDSFKKNKQLEIHTEHLADGAIIKVDTGYSESLSRPGSPYRTYNGYYSNFVLKYTVNTFYDIQYGKYYEYDENGVLTKAVDEDLPYKFTIENLIHKMLKDFKIDLRIAKPGMYVRRYVRSDTKLLPKYEINYPSGSSKHRIIRLDGTTGKVLSDNIVGSVDD